VQPGDTLWSIASRLAPTRDPRAEVLDLQKINHLSGVDVFPGQVLHVK
jgi:LysM repeat protein